MSDYVWDVMQQFLVHDVNAPEIVLEENGDLCFDWNEKGASISVSLSREGRIGWSALIGDFKDYESFMLPNWSARLDKAFTKYREATDRW